MTSKIRILQIFKHVHLGLQASTLVVTCSITMISPAANSMARMNYYEIITTEIFREYWILEIYFKNKEMYKIINSPVFFNT